LTSDIIALATEYGRYGYRRIKALPWAAGWVVNVKRVERIRRKEGQRIPRFAVPMVLPRPFLSPP
jgi:hypothetical protein